MKTLQRRFIAVPLLVVLCACSGPVRTANCDIMPSSSYGTVLRAQLTNTSSTTVTHVGVLVGTLEYEFPVRIPPHETTHLLIGRPFGNDSSQTPPLSPVEQDMRGAIPDAQCWARWVDFADGSNYNVSPL